MHSAAAAARRAHATRTFGHRTHLTAGHMARRGLGGYDWKAQELKGEYWPLELGEQGAGRAAWAGSMPRAAT